MEFGTLDGWVSSVLSGIAILVGIVLAGVALRQSSTIARNQQRMEVEAYLSQRMNELATHAREIVHEAGLIMSAIGPRMDELLSVSDVSSDEKTARRQAVTAAISRLDASVDLLRIYAVTMPRVGDKSHGPSSAISRLMDEGTWLSANALYSAICVFAEGDNVEDVDLNSNQAVADTLLNGTFVNLSPRLLSDCVGMDPDNVPSMGQPGSPWESIYARRETLLMTEVLPRASWRPDSISEAAIWALAHSSNRFQDALLEVLGEWDKARIAA